MCALAATADGLRDAGDVGAEVERRARRAGRLLVCRCEGLLRVLSSCVGGHGYRSQRWMGGAALAGRARRPLRRPRRSVRAAAVRTSSMLLSESAGLSASAAEHAAFEPMLTQLLADGGGRRDTLCNSAILQLLRDVAESDGHLSFVRMHLLRRHRSCRRLAAADVHPARQLLLGDADGGPPSPARTAEEDAAFVRLSLPTRPLAPSAARPPC